MYQCGQIITKEEHIEFANWANVNGGKFYSEPNGDGTYTVREVVVIEPTTEEIASQKRTERDGILSQTDRYMIVDYPITDEKRAQYKAYRQYLRDIPADSAFPNVEILTFDEWAESQSETSETVAENMEV